MNLADLKAGLEKNKKGLALAGAGAVAGLALMNSSRGGGGAPAAAGDEEGVGSKYGLAPMPATGMPYDSSSSDTYNAIQPQLEDLGQKQSALERLIESMTKKSSDATAALKKQQDAALAAQKAEAKRQSDAFNAALKKLKPPVPVAKPPAPKPAAPRPAAPRPAAPKPAAAPKPRVYTVKAGDNLSRIAGRLGVSGGWQSLYSRNRGVIGGNANLIRPGQKLTY